MKGVTMKTILRALSALVLTASSKTALGAAMCSTLVAPGVQVTLNGDFGDHVVQPSVSLKGSDEAIDLDGEGGFYLSDVLPVGDYTLKLIDGEQILYTQDFTLVRSKACYVAPFVATYACGTAADAEGVETFGCGPQTDEAQQD